MLSNVLAIRPYTERIRQKMVAHIKNAGFSVNADQAIPAGTTDNEIIQKLNAMNESEYILLIPYNAQIDRSGNNVDGLDLIIRIHNEVPAFKQAPILMPVSNSAMVSIKYKLKEKRRFQSLPKELDEHILFISESDMAKTQLVDRIKNHVAQF